MVIFMCLLPQLKASKQTNTRLKLARRPRVLLCRSEAEAVLEGGLGCREERVLQVGGFGGLGVRVRSRSASSWEPEPGGSPGAWRLFRSVVAGGRPPSAVPRSLQGRLKVLRSPCWGVTSGSLPSAHCGRLWGCAWGGGGCSSPRKGPRRLCRGGVAEFADCAVVIRS